MYLSRLVGGGWNLSDELIDVSRDSWEKLMLIYGYVELVSYMYIYKHVNKCVYVCVYVGMSRPYR